METITITTAMIERAIFHLFFFEYKSALCLLFNIIFINLCLNNKKIDLVAQITIGRSSDNQVVIDNKLASRHHAVIQKIKNAYFIKDAGSTNGTFVNSTIIPSGKYLQ